MLKFGTKDDVEGLRPCRKTANAHAKRIYEPFEVVTLEGTMRGSAGDYLMRGVEGEFYPCAASVFASSYAWSEPAVRKQGPNGEDWGETLALLAERTRERDVAQGQAQVIRREFGAVETWTFPWDEHPFSFEDVKSSNIHSVGYTINTCDLHIRFHRKDAEPTHYHYRDVPNELHEQMMAAPSVGKYFAANIKGRFEFSRVDA